MLVTNSVSAETEKKRRNAEYADMLKESIRQADEGKLIPLTMEELQTFTADQFQRRKAEAMKAWAKGR
jgi:hypothetical protein